ncbi:hypothetical protein A9Q99_07510 [Gammaproteobacteria bacterium 45_16_T64]|nr:hypothetical protein A9Q99_07510 [Gammaproteobacteria bacterium 45_16_T64]
MKRKIAILCFEQCQMLDLSGPMDVLTDGAIPAARGYDLDVLSIEGGLLRSSSGLMIHTEKCKPLAGYDSLMVIGGQGVFAAIADSRLVEYIQAQAPEVSRVISICTGAFLLAQAGLLNGRAATTHWVCTRELQQLFPRVKVLPDDLYVKSGNVYTSAGVTAGIDLTLSIVAEDLGHDISMQIAKSLVVYYHRPGGQKQFSSPLNAQLEARPMFDKTRLYIEENLHSKLTVEVLSSVANMSERNFSRQFSSGMGVTPAKYVEGKRIDRIKLLLESTHYQLDNIAELTGFASVDVMRRTFVRHMGVAPVDYRLKFSRKAMSNGQ